MREMKKRESILEFINKVGEMASQKVVRRREGQQAKNGPSILDSTSMNLIKELCQRRIMQGLSRQELSEKTGLDYTMLVLLENGILAPEEISQSDIDKIVKVFLHR